MKRLIALPLVVLTLAATSHGAQTKTTPTKRVRTADLFVRGLICHGCAVEVFKALVYAPGFVKVVNSDTAHQVLRVQYDASRIKPETLARRITDRTDFPARVVGSAPRKVQVRSGV